MAMVLVYVWTPPFVYIKSIHDETFAITKLLQCKHPYLIALNPFIGKDIVAVVVAQFELNANRI